MKCCVNKPQRPAYFANKFCRLLTKSAAAMEIGADVCWMLTVIVNQEDSTKYSKPINYWNEQLQALCGFGSRKRLVTARKKAIDAGWLHYEQGDKRKPGIYWVTLPAGLKLADSGSCHESDLETDGGANRNGKPLMGYQNGTANAESDLLRGVKTERQRGAMRNGKSAPSIPNPKPYSPNQGPDAIEKKAKRTKQPTEQDAATAKFIWALLLKIQPGRTSPDLAKWANDVRLMREQDNRTDDQIRKVFRSANSDAFWKKNILSTSKLREKFDDLALKLSVGLSKPDESEFLPPRKPRTS